METASNSSEDCDCSAVSSISGLTGYEDEFNEIKSLIKSTNDLSATTPKPSPKKHANVDILSYELRINYLNAELQNAYRLNEKHKNDLFALQRKNELEYHDKFEKLVSRNAQLDADLHNANSHIENILRSTRSQNGKVRPQFDERLVLLEKKIYELEVEKNAASADAEHWKTISSTQSVAIEKNEMKIIDFSDELSIKRSCINELKNKIAEQHVELENVKRKNEILESNRLSMDSELERFKNSADWYKEQLHTCQNNKNKITEELLALKLSHNKDALDKDGVVRELNDCRNKFKDLSSLCERQKNCFDRKIDQMENNLLETVGKDDEFALIKAMHNEEIETLIGEIANVRKTISEQTDLFEKINKENSQLHSRNAVTQKLLNDKIIQYDLLENGKKDVLADLQDATNTLKRSENNLLLTRAEISKLKLSLDEANKENKAICATTLQLRGDFQKFTDAYKKLRAETDGKEKIIFELQKTRQEIFMHNNWNVCEIEEFKSREKEYLSKIDRITRDGNDLNRDLDSVQRSLKNAQSEVTRLQGTNDLFSKTNQDLNENLNKLNAKHQKLLATEDDYLHKIAFYKSSIDELNCQLKQTECYKITFKAVVEILCQKLCKIFDRAEDNRTIREILNNNLNMDLYLVEMLDKLDSYLIMINANYLKMQNDCVSLKTHTNGNAAGRGKVVSFKKKLFGRINEIQSRCDVLSKKCAESENFFKKIPYKSGMRCDEIVKLKTAIKVKDLDHVEKLKRYEINNRTLLRKIKEHMRERNTAEKRSKCLQDLYDSTSLALNTTKLQLNQKDFEIDEGKNLLEIKCRALEKALNTLTNLKKDLAANNIDCRMLREENEALKIGLKNVESELVLANGKIEECLIDFKSKHQTILTLKNQIAILHKSHETLQQTHLNCDKQQKTSQNEILSIQRQLEKQSEEIGKKSTLLDELNKDLDVAKALQSDYLSQIKRLREEMAEFKERNDFYEKEIEIMNCDILRKDEEIGSYQRQKLKWESDNEEREVRLKSLLTRSEDDVRELRENLKLAVGEKYFHQRLSSDLKIALNSTVKENQELKENLSKQLDSTECRSLPNFISNLPRPNELDETKINSLLQRTNSLGDKRPFNDLHDSLNSLKREMASLQQQIAEKKFRASSL